MNNLETRILNEDIEVRSLEDGTSEISGYGIVFNSYSEVMGDFKERILPTALDNVDLTDIVATFNHDPNHLLGRTTAGTMSIEKNNRGVKYFIKLPNTASANDLKEHIKLGNVRGSSFTFSMKYDEGDDEWVKKPDGSYVRTINRIDRVYEIGPVVMPAYPATTVKLRDIIASLKEKEKEEAAAKAKLEIELQKRKLEIEIQTSI